MSGEQLRCNFAFSFCVAHAVSLAISALLFLHMESIFERALLQGILPSMIPGSRFAWYLSKDEQARDVTSVTQICLAILINCRRLWCLTVVFARFWSMTWFLALPHPLVSVNASSLTDRGPRRHPDYYYRLWLPPRRNITFSLMIHVPHNLG